MAGLLIDRYQNNHPQAWHQVYIDAVSLRVNKVDSYLLLETEQVRVVHDVENGEVRFERNE